MKTIENQISKFVTVEGNVGSGKSTVLPKLAMYLSKQDDKEWVQVQEPVDDPEFDALLRKFYDEPTTENRIKFQYFITERRYSMCQGLDDDKNYLIERSLFSDFIFCQVSFLAMEAPKGEYMQYFYHIKEKMKSYPFIGACVYLRTNPTIAWNRMMGRGREAEMDVKLEYLEDLHRFHEACLPQTCKMYGAELMTYDWDSFDYPLQSMATEILTSIK